MRGDSNRVLDTLPDSPYPGKELASHGFRESLRSDIFILGIIMVVLGPVLVAGAASSCLFTILSGNIFACANVLPVFIGGGALFVAGIITCLVGVIVSEPNPRPHPPAGSMSAPQAGSVTCKKCGRVNAFGLFSCPFCGQTSS